MILSPTFYLSKQPLNNARAHTTQTQNLTLTHLEKQIRQLNLTNRTPLSLLLYTQFNHHFNPKANPHTHTTAHSHI